MKVRISKHPKYPSYTTLFRWLREKPDFAVKYARAKQDFLEEMAAEIIEIVDARVPDADGNIDFDVPPPSRPLDKQQFEHMDRQVAHRKWLLAVSQPRKYGS